MHALCSTGANVEIQRNPLLNSLDIEGLQVIGGSLLLSQLEMPELGLMVHQVGRSVNIEDSPSLNRLNLSWVTNVEGNFEITRNPSLKLVTVDCLHTVGNNFVLSQLLVTELLLKINSVGQSFTVKKCPKLTFLEILHFASAGNDFTIHHNPALESLKMDEL
ncbi:hypothetical protein DSO57_1010436 [Entomophthora muscae]|uniref:Uncharacterized protein n=1 Tax=Entomophthora muscae TaxID=34485 RepID=A0ACC2RXS7_9FUNG|nr:hypothetical protein DSO57_1010436 [Entomophthora muscae]